MPHVDQESVRKACFHLQLLTTTLLILFFFLQKQHFLKSVVKEFTGWNVLLPVLRSSTEKLHNEMKTGGGKRKGRN